jgi:outer membrane protein assembly factor BamA
LILLASCSSSKNLKDNELLLTSVEIIIQKDDKDSAQSISKSEISRLKGELNKLSIQQPNKKFLFIFKPRLGIYNMASNPQKEAKRKAKNKPPVSKFNSWLRDKAGEPPVIFDATQIASSEDRMQNFLINNGYFQALVKGSYIEERKRARIQYHINLGQRYFFNRYILEIEDPNLDSIIRKELHLTTIKKGEPYTTDALKAEQERIASSLNNQGYFSFTKKYITFEVDTSVPGLMKDVYLIVKKDEDGLEHRLYQIGQVTFNINYANSGLKRSKIEADTLRNLYLYYSRQDMRPDIIARRIFYMPDSIFKKDDYQKTVARLNDLGIFRFVNIKYKPLLISQTEGYIDTEIVAELRKRQSGRIELEANTDARDRIGTFINFAYINRNIFHRADRFQFNISNGVDLRFNNIQRDGVKDQRLNALNLILNSRLNFPTIFPQTQKSIARNNYQPQLYPKSTFINVGYNLQRRLGFFAYVVNTFTIGFGYDIRNKNIRHEFQPFNLSFIKPRPSSFNVNFEDFLQRNPIFALSYRQQFIMGQEYIFSYSTQNIKIGKVRSFFYYRGLINSAGNLTYAIKRLVSGKPEAGYTLAGIPYATFLKLDNDLRYYFNFKNNTSLVVRTFLGVGLPYGNSTIMPFIKQYAAGGPQSMRGWNYRELGPGSLDTSLNTPDLNTGDLQFEANLEYRFSLSKLFKAALFTDMGNVWLLRADSTKPNADFAFNRFASDLAWSAGFGFRLDFGLFVIRLDNSYKLHNPNWRKGERWIFQYPGYDALSDANERGNWRSRWGAWRSRYANFVIGIGYPF